MANTTNGTPLYNIYPALSVPVTTAAASLLTLLRNVDATIQPRAREITLQNDPSSAANIRIGGLAGSTTGVVSPTNCGYVLVPGASRTYRDGDDYSAPLSNMAVLTDSGSAQLNVELVRK